MSSTIGRWSLAPQMVCRTSHALTLGRSRSETCGRGERERGVSEDARERARGKGESARRCEGGSEGGSEEGRRRRGDEEGERGRRRGRKRETHNLVVEPPADALLAARELVRVVGPALRVLVEVRVPLAPNVDESLVARAGVRVELAPEALDLDVGHAGRLVVVRLPVADVGRPGRDDVEIARPDDGLLGVERAQVRLERAVPALLVGEALEALAGVGDVCRWEDKVRGRSREGRCRAGSEREDERGTHRCRRRTSSRTRA